MNTTVAVIGLGYVGLPLAMAFAEKYSVLAYDINTTRIEQIRGGRDVNGEVTAAELNKVIKSDIRSAAGLYPTDNPELLREANIFIVTVPTPVDDNKKPDLTILLKATEIVARYLTTGDGVIFESTVYPGCTEEDCVPVLEKISGLRLNDDFYVGYSPERINPGDKTHTFFNTKKITSGSSPEAAEKIDALYASVIPAGTFPAASIKIAEAAKAVENAQRDINISFMNELSLIFDKMNIDTYKVLEAAATKWNFLRFSPGLVGGHCIGVDPYYLSYKAEQVGINTQVINSGRSVNERMGAFVADKTERLIKEKSGTGNDSSGKKNVLILGFTFKENCPDIRNTGVKKLYDALLEKGFDTEICDPWADGIQVREEYGISLLSELPSEKSYTAVILAVPHTELLSCDFRAWKNNGSVIFDIKGVLPPGIVDGTL